jgi:RNA polymerase sigma factor (sigma-70 family)
MKVENRQNSSCSDEADRELLRRFQNGDEAAFVELLEIHAGLFKKWVRRVLNKVPWAQWDDLMQEAHFGFYLAAKKFDFSKKGNFHGLARMYARKMFDSREVRVAKRTPYKNYRKVTTANDRLMTKWNRPPTLDELSKEAELTVRQVKAALNVIVAFPFPLEEAESALVFEDPYQSQLISDAIGQLSSAQAEVITRRMYGDKFREIAKALGRSIDDVKKLNERGKKRLMAIIHDKGIQKDGT